MRAFLELSHLRLEDSLLDHTPGFLKLVAEAQGEVKEVSIEDVQVQLKTPKDFILIDVREDHEWQLSHLPHAVHLSKGIIERDIETQFPDPQTPLVLYCGGGYRSILAAQSLRKMGYTQVRSMAGGFRAWTERQLPTITD